MNSRKGISPLVATVLLVAFTVSVGAILGAWVTGFSKTKTEDIQKTGSNTIDCAGASIKFDNLDVGFTQIALTNNGQEELNGFIIAVQNGTGENLKINQYEASGINQTNTLKPGEKKIISNSSMNILAGNTVIVTSTKCVSVSYKLVK